MNYLYKLKSGFLPIIRFQFAGSMLFGQVWLDKQCFEVLSKYFSGKDGSGPHRGPCA